MYHYIIPFHFFPSSLLSKHFSSPIHQFQSNQLRSVSLFAIFLFFLNLISSLFFSFHSHEYFLFSFASYVVLRSVFCHRKILRGFCRRYTMQFLRIERRIRLDTSASIRLMHSRARKFVSMRSPVPDEGDTRAIAFFNPRRAIEYTECHVIYDTNGVRQTLWLEISQKWMNEWVNERNEEITLEKFYL